MAFRIEGDGPTRAAVLRLVVLLLTSYERARPFDVEAALERASRFRYVVAFAVETDYFEDSDVG